jgi:hypothetical protein
METIMGTIITKYHGPTDHQGSRIVATANTYGTKTRILVGYDYSLNSLDNHTEAAMKLAQKIGWHDQWIASDTHDGRGYVFTRASKLRYQEIHSYANEEEFTAEHVERLIGEVNRLGLDIIDERDVLITQFPNEEA